MTYGRHGDSTPIDRRSERPASPRRVRNGLRLKADDQAVPQHWSARRWMNLVQAAFAPDVLAAGLEYAKLGQVASLDIRPALVEAQVQGRAPQPYSTVIRLAPLEPGQWDSLIAGMAEEAIYTAKLLAGEFPPLIGKLATSLGREIIPLEPQAVSFECTCREEKPCKHAAAAGFLVAHRLDQEPMLSFTLAGMVGERVIGRLREARDVHTRGVASAHCDGLTADRQFGVPPLEASIEEFWRSGPELSLLQQTPPPQHVSHALLRRLGPSPLKGKFPLVGLLASVYDTVAAAAIHLRDQAERIENGNASEGDEPTS